MAKQPLKAWRDMCKPRWTCHRFQHPEAHEAQDIHVSVPDRVKPLEELLSEEKEKKRWIFTPSFNRCDPGPQQAPLDRSDALRTLLPNPDVGHRCVHLR